MKRSRIWLMGGVGIAVIWLAALAAMAWARAATVTPEKIVAYVDGAKLGELSADLRRSHIDGLADRMNRLGFEDRRDPALRDRLRDLFIAMTPEERSRYLEAVLPRGMQQMMDAINQMSREDRQAMVERALTQMQRNQDEGRRAEMETQLGKEAMQRIVDEGLRSYMRDATAESKLDLEPLITQMQRNMRRMDRR